MKKKLRTLVAMLTEHKNTEIFFMADDFCKFFDGMMLNFVLESNKKRIFYREIKMSKDKNIKLISQTSNGFIVLNHGNRVLIIASGGCLIYCGFIVYIEVIYCFLDGCICLRIILYSVK